MLKNTRGDVVKAAKVVFARLGYQKTTLRDIADEARIGRTAVYHYFPDKLRVFQEVISLELDEIAERTEEAVRAGKDPAGRFRAYVETRLKVVLELANVYSAMVDEYLDRIESIEAFRKQALEREVRTLKAVLDEGVLAGVFDVTDTALAASGVSMALKGLEYPLLAFRTGGANAEAQVNSVIDLLLWGIMKR